MVCQNKVSPAAFLGGKTPNENDRPPAASSSRMVRAPPGMVDGSPPAIRPGYRHRPRFGQIVSAFGRSARSGAAPGPWRLPPRRRAVSPSLAGVATPAPLAGPDDPVGLLRPRIQQALDAFLDDQRDLLG